MEQPSRVTEGDINLNDAFLPPGYGRLNPPTSRAILLCAQTEGLLLDPVYTGKVMAEVLRAAEEDDNKSRFVFIHTGGTPAIFGYQKSIESALENFDERPGR